MVNAQAVYLAFCNQFKNQTVGSLEDVLIFHADSREVVGIEKAAVIDVLRSDPPVGQAIGLRFYEFVKFIEGGRGGRTFIDLIKRCGYAIGNFPLARSQSRPTAP